MVVYCSQVRYTFNRQYARDGRNTLPTAGEITAKMFSSANDTSPAKNSKQRRLSQSYRGQGKYSLSNSSLSLSNKYQNHGKIISKSLDHLPSISVGRPRQRVVRRQSSLNQLDGYLTAAYTRQEEATVTAKPGSCWTLPKIQVDYGHSSDQTTSTNSIPETPSEKSSCPVSDGVSSFLPPLPSGSLIFQAALRDTYTERDCAVSSFDACSDSGSDGRSSSSSGSCSSRKRAKLSWCGPLVEYKGQHIFLSTLENIHLNLGRYGSRRWQ